MASDRLVVAWSAASARTIWSRAPDRTDDLEVVPYSFDDVQVGTVDPVSRAVSTVVPKNTAALVERAGRVSEIVLVLPGRPALEWAGRQLVDSLDMAGIRAPVRRVAPVALTRQHLAAAWSRARPFDRSVLAAEQAAREHRWAVDRALAPALKKAGLPALGYDDVMVLAGLAAATDRDQAGLRSFRPAAGPWPAWDAGSAVALAPDLAPGTGPQLYDRLIDTGLLACREPGDSADAAAQDELAQLADRQFDTCRQYGRAVRAPWLTAPEIDLATVSPDVRPAYVAAWRRASGLEGPRPPGLLAGNTALATAWLAARTTVDDRRWWAALAVLRASDLVAGWSALQVTAAGRYALARIDSTWAPFTSVPAQGPCMPAYGAAVHQACRRGESALDAGLEWAERARTNRPAAPVPWSCRSCGSVPAVKPAGRDLVIDCSCGRREPADVWAGTVAPVRAHDRLGWCGQHGVTRQRVTAQDGRLLAACKTCR